MSDRAEWLDLAQFSSCDDALERIRRDRGFDAVATPILRRLYDDRAATITLLSTFFSSAITRARGLHEGIVREIEANNPYAAFPLIRQFAEGVALVLYIADNPNYVVAIATQPRDWKHGQPKRISMQKLANYMDRKHSEQFKIVYAELSEMTHFGTFAMWTAHTIQPHEDDPDGVYVAWRSEPGWKDDRQFYIACAQTLELSDAMETALHNLGVRCLREQEQLAERSSPTGEG